MLFFVAKRYVLFIERLTKFCLFVQRARFFLRYKSKVNQLGKIILKIKTVIFSYFLCSSLPL
jgi:hypothetical protein